jgi:hypothetical protein
MELGKAARRAGRPRDAQPDTIMVETNSTAAARIIPDFI